MTCKTSRGVRAVLVAILATVLASGCGLAATYGTEHGEMRLGVDDSGRRVVLQPGQTVVLSLDANPSTGYIWETVHAAEPVLRQVGDSEFRPGSERVGASGTQVLRFEAAAAGQASLELAYRRPWEKGATPRQTFSLEVMVP